MLSLLVFKRNRHPGHSSSTMLHVVFALSGQFQKCINLDLFRVTILHNRKHGVFKFRYAAVVHLKGTVLPHAPHQAGRVHSFCTCRLTFAGLKGACGCVWSPPACLCKELTGNTAPSDSHFTQALQNFYRQNARTVF